ncbi:MAG: hypothetical protein L0Z46_12350 [Nitrospiraceae bacterium]|nr:hypothetical protein [Nitrospiraceae bacterium]
MRFQWPADVPAVLAAQGHKYPDGSSQRMLQGRCSTSWRIYLRLIDDGLTATCSETARAPLAHERVRFRTHDG